MNLQATVRGSSLADMRARADAICKAFYGTDPYEIVYQSWASATAEKFDDLGNVTGFMFNMEAHPVI